MEDEVFSRSKSDQPSMGIMMAPLIDVVFLLLIFFMVTTTFQIQPGLNIEMPRSGGKTDVPDERWVISISTDGELYLNDERSTISNIRTSLKDNKRPVVLRADKSIPHGMVVRVLDTVRDAGVSNVDISTRPLNADSQ